MLFEVDSKKSLAEIGRGLEEAAARHQFGIIGVHDLRQKMLEKGVELSNDCMIYEVCNPMQAKKVLEANGAISTALPCRISVYRSGGGYKIATILPTAMLGLFKTPGLEPVAREVENTVIAMMKETA
jgi:uncharacterized protein (DUF302 family)